MGTRSFSVFIKTDQTHKFSLEKISTELFNPENLKIPYDLLGGEMSIWIGRYKNGILIINYYLTWEIIAYQNENWIKRIYDFFAKPELIVAYVLNDHNMSAGYSVIKEGEIIRYRYDEPFKDTNRTGNFGIPYKVEIDQLNKLEISKEKGFDTERQMNKMTIYHTGKTTYYYYVDFFMVNAIVTELLGYSAYENSIPNNIDVTEIKFVSEKIENGPSEKRLLIIN